MFAQRLARPARQTVLQRSTPLRRNVRFASDAAPKATPNTAAGSGAITGGLVGGTVALAIAYGYYHVSGAKSAVQYANTAKRYLDSGADSLKVQFAEQTPDDADQAMQTLREAAQKYAGFIPGGRGYVDSAFDDLGAIRKKHGDEVDRIVKEAYGELREASKKGVDLETAGEVWRILSKRMEQLLSLGGDAAEDILNNHPEIKKKLGGSTEQLKQLGQKYGPEAKKQVDETWDQLSDLVKSGVGIGTADKARRLVEDKIQKVREMGEKAFEQGFEQVQPMLDKNPQVRDFVEENLQTLKQSGNVAEAVEQVKKAVSSGSTKDLEAYVKQAKQGAEQFGSSQLAKWLEMVPNGGQIVPQLQRLREVAESKGERAEELVKETIGEVQKILSKKTQEAEQLYEEGKKDASK